MPPPDAIPGLARPGFQISLWPYPHTWPYTLNAESEKSPFRDKRVRQAINYAVDREGIVKLLNGTAKPAAGLYPPESAFFGSPQNKYTYDPEKAKALLAEAGYGPKNPVKAKIMISTAGSGQMLPLPMNEFIQQTLKPLGIELEFEVVEWGTMLVAVRSAPSAPQSMGVDAINCSLSFTDPSAHLSLLSLRLAFSPANWNWGHWKNAEADKLMTAAQTEFDPEKQVELLSKAHAIVVDEAAWLFVVHDLNPRAMSKKVKGFSPAQSWSQDFTTISMELRGNQQMACPPDIATVMRDQAAAWSSVTPPNAVAEKLAAAFAETIAGLNGAARRPCLRAGAGELPGSASGDEGDRAMNVHVSQSSALGNFTLTKRPTPSHAARSVRSN